MTLLDFSQCETISNRECKRLCIQNAVGSLVMLDTEFILSHGVHKLCRQIASNHCRDRLAENNEWCLDSKILCFLAGKSFSYYECWGRKGFSFLFYLVGSKFPQHQEVLHVSGPRTKSK